jgi:hypothetical protein
MENDRKDKGYDYDDLIKIGDQIHESKTALIVSDIEHEDGTHTTMGSATGKRRDIIIMLFTIMKSNPQLEELISEAVLMKKMKDIGDMFSQIKGNLEDEDDI